MSSGAAFTVFCELHLCLPELRLGVLSAFMYTRAAFVVQSRHSSGNGFQSTASFLKTCTVHIAHFCYDFNATVVLENV